MMMAMTTRGRKERETLQSWLSPPTDAAPELNLHCRQKKKRNGEAEGATAAYLLVVVVGQALAVQPHPPPLEDAIPAGKKRGGCGGAHRQRQSVKGGRDGDEARRRREVV